MFKKIAMTKNRFLTPIIIIIFFILIIWMINVYLSEIQYLDAKSQIHLFIILILISLIITGLSFFFFYLYLEKTKVRLAETEKKLIELLNRKNRFTNMVSHELRTPLTSIKEGINIVLDGSTGAINGDQKDFLETAKRNVDRLAQLITDILDFQKLESGRLIFNIKPQSIKDIADDIYKGMHMQAREKGLDFNLSVDPNALEVNCDKDKIMQVLKNIISNAINFTNKGAITLTIAKENNTIHFIVEDTGIGIAKDNLPKLFQAFSKLDNQTHSGNSGLGLAMAKEIIEKHRGKIWAESELGKGCKFHFLLPIVERRR